MKFCFTSEECIHCDHNAHCVGGHCICKSGFVGDGLDCWGEKQFLPAYSGRHFAFLAAQTLFPLLSGIDRF